ncbi:hypothetical protein XELAEV_18010255mg [Xenopus laevis]|uniref:Uncharacterized protein n=1 Tax=Xenopus laevis TaxID=8355 RepID=A0A974I1J0_XENLA|nr:hypothetical protein XELAEV_18010255mg [Xenopus laevis]
MGIAEAALDVAKANSNLLKQLQEEMSGLRKLTEKTETFSVHMPTSNTKCKTSEDEDVEEIHGVQVVIEELRKLGAASASLVPGLHTLSLDRTPRDGCLSAGPSPSEVNPLLSPMHVPVIDDFLNSEAPAARILAPSFPTLSTHSHLLIQKDDSLSPGGIIMAETSSASAEITPPISPSPLAPLYLCTNSGQFGNGQKCSRRKRDLVLSKLVHNIHNHISNNKRFNGSESIKSSWNILILKFLVEKLKQELVSSIHHYTDKELKGDEVHLVLREKEEKKLRSRRYRLFANRSWGVQQFSVEDQALWEGVTEELMSDEEDSLSEPGVWVARPPRFRTPELTRLCYSIDSHSKHGNKTNRVHGTLSDRLPSAEAQLLPPHLYNPNWEGNEVDSDAGEVDAGGRGSKSFCPDLNSFIQIKVEKDE